MTSAPASRSAIATTLTPRSWPSSPGFASTTLMRLPLRLASSQPQVSPAPPSCAFRSVWLLPSRRLRQHHPHAPSAPSGFFPAAGFASTTLMRSAPGQGEGREGGVDLGGLDDVGHAQVLVRAVHRLTAGPEDDRGH